MIHAFGFPHTHTKKTKKEAHPHDSALGLNLDFLKDYFQWHFIQIK